MNKLNSLLPSILIGTTEQQKGIRFAKKIFFVQFHGTKLKSYFILQKYSIELLSNCVHLQPIFQSTKVIYFIALLGKLSNFMRAAERVTVVNFNARVAELMHQQAKRIGGWIRSFR
jgi:hypothetical protein